MTPWRTRGSLFHDTLPTLSHYRTSDWFSWYYDCSDIHFIKGDAAAGTYYAGVTNDQMRADAGARSRRRDAQPRRRRRDAAVPPRLQRPRHLRRRDGRLQVRRRLGGVPGERAGHVPVPRRDLAVDETVGGTVRIGNWDYYKLAVGAAQARKHKLAVEFYLDAARLAHRAAAAAAAAPSRRLRPQHGRVHLRRQRQGRLRADPGAAHVARRQRDGPRGRRLVRGHLQHLGP